MKHATEDAYFWLTYEQQLARSKSKYNYQTNLKTFRNVKNLEIFVKIKESRNLKRPSASSGNVSLTESKISDKE